MNRDENRFNQYGGSLGGPIWKNKVFAFFNYETSPLQSSTTAQGWYETSQFHNSANLAPIASQYLGFAGSRACSQCGRSDTLLLHRLAARSQLQTKSPEAWMWDRL